jgi:hypothetical protein
MAFKTSQSYRFKFFDSACPFRSQIGAKPAKTSHFAAIMHRESDAMKIPCYVVSKVWLFAARSVL